MLNERSETEHKYTSTGIKFWSHSNQMNSFKEGSGNTIISTHISPEGSCNLNCSYCSVKKRTKLLRIELPVIKDYITKLKSRGLKAVIITGGGEPTLYPHINELISWLKYDMNLNVALITNGTMSDRIEPDNWRALTWVRVSINNFDRWEDKIRLPINYLDKCVVGCSCIYTNQNIEFFKKVARLAAKLNATYVRLLPDCLLDQDELIKKHKELDILCKNLDNPIFFHQYKIHGAPKCSVCHQAFFRPYLSEVDGGTVFPCDSVVLNDKFEHFNSKFKLCKASEILDFLDGKIKMLFNPIKDCSGCVFTYNINMLDDWKNYGIKPDIPNVEVIHKEFV